MRLVWHIAKKDIRRMALPVGLWVAFIVATAVWFESLWPQPEGHVTSEIGAWLAAMSIWTQLLMVGQLVMGYLLVGTLALEDPVAGAGAFWVTRPISGIRLLAAKLLAATLLFVVGPITALVAVGLACGSSLIAVAGAVGGVAAKYGVSLIVALSLASLARNLGQFIFGSIALLLLAIACAFLGVYLETKVAMPVHYSRAVIFDTGVVLILGLGLALVQLFLTRRVARSWCIVALALGASVVLRVYWPWDVWRGMESRASAARLVKSPPDANRAIDVTGTLVKFSRSPKESPHLVVNTRPMDAGVYAPMLARTTDGRVLARATSSWGDVAALRALGFQGAEKPLRWRTRGGRGMRIESVDFTRGPRANMKPGGGAMVVLVETRPAPIGQMLRAAAEASAWFTSWWRYDREGYALLNRERGEFVSVLGEGASRSPRQLVVNGVRVLWYVKGVDAPHIIRGGTWVPVAGWMSGVTLGRITVRQEAVFAREVKVDRFELKPEEKP